MIKLKRKIGLVLAVTLLTFMLCAPVYATGNMPTDMPEEGHWSWKAVLWAYEHHIIKGVDDSHIAPFAEVTRAQAIMMMWKLAGSPAPSGNKAPPFKDVSTTAYYYQALCYMWEHGAVKGVSMTSFGPDLPCTRAQFVTIAWWVFPPVPDATVDDSGPEPVKDVTDFVDVNEDDYYFDPLDGYCRYGVIAGIDETHFCPDLICNRAQAAVILYKIYFSPYYS